MRLREVKSLAKSHTVGWDSLKAKAPILNQSCPPSLTDPIFPEGCPHGKKPKVPPLQLTWLEKRGMRLRLHRGSSPIITQELKETEPGPR